MKIKFIKDRRAASQDTEKYSKIVRKFKINEKKIMETSYKEMIVKENINAISFELARDEYLNKHEVATEREKLKQLISVGVAPDSIDVEKLKIIMDTEIKLLADAHSVEDVVTNIETISRIEDKLFEEFGYEIEEIRAASVKYQGEVKSLSRQIIRNYQRFKL